VEPPTFSGQVEDSHGGPDVLLSSDSTADTSSEESNDEIPVKEETRETHSTSEQVEQNHDSVVQQEQLNVVVENNPEQLNVVLEDNPEQLNVVLEDNPEPVMHSPLNVQEISGAEEVSRRRMIELENELVTERTRNAALDETIRQQRMDIQSLRYEISWKDERIVFLQRELARLLASSGTG